MRINVENALSLSVILNPSEIHSLPNLLHCYDERNFQVYNIYGATSRKSRNRFTTKISMSEFCLSQTTYTKQEDLD